MARAIMTTDTRPKETAVTFELEGRTVHMGGVAKGSGMIHPNMATMLSFIATDAAVEPGFLQATLSEIADETYNMLSVDGDSSTNDTVLVMANGRRRQRAGFRGFTRCRYLCRGFADALHSPDPGVGPGRRGSLPPDRGGRSWGYGHR